MKGKKKGIYVCEYQYLHFDFVYGNPIVPISQITELMRPAENLFLHESIGTGCS
jgi:hypothetical protein